jgi:hypothetical protein
MDILAWIGDSRVGGLLSVIGVGLAIASYFWRRDKTVLLYAVAEASIASTHNEGRFKDDLKIYFQGQPVPTVTSSRFWIWNGGNTLIRSSDIASSDRLRVTLPPDATILQFTIGKSSRPVNNARFVLPEGSVNHEGFLDFDFLEPTEGFVVELVHTADRKAAALQGTVLNSPQSPVRSLYMSVSELRDTRFVGRLLMGFSIATGLYFLVSAYSPELLEDPEWLKELTATGQIEMWLSAIIAVLLFSLAAFFQILLMSSLKSRIPAALEDIIP